MPPIRSFLYKVNFYYSFAHDATEYWLSEAKLWSKDVDKFAEPSKPIKAAVDGLIAPGDSDLDKAKKLYVAVQALDNTDYSRQRTATEMKQLKLKDGPARRRHLGAEEWIERRHRHALSGHAARRRAHCLCGQGGGSRSRGFRSVLHGSGPARHDRGGAQYRRPGNCSRSRRKDVSVWDAELAALKRRRPRPEQPGSGRLDHTGAKL